jgi:hypothetical protein
MGWAAPIVSGIGQYQAAQGEKAQYNFNAKSEMIGADEEAAASLADLNDTLSAYNAQRTARGLDIASPTGMALASGLTKKTDSNIKALQLNHASRAQSDLFGAWGAQQKGTYALYGGFLQSLNQMTQDAAMAGY